MQMGCKFCNSKKAVWLWNEIQRHSYNFSQCDFK